MGSADTLGWEGEVAEVQASSQNRVPAGPHALSLRFMVCVGRMRTPDGQLLPERSKDTTYISLMKLRGERRGCNLAAAA